MEIGQIRITEGVYRRQFQCRQFQSNCRKFDEIGMDYYNSTLIAIGTIKRFSRIVKLCSMMAAMA